MSVLPLMTNLLIDGAYRLIEKYNVPKHLYEFQMLYGVTPNLRQSIVNNGHTMRVYVPFGKNGSVIQPAV